MAKFTTAQLHERIEALERRLGRIPAARVPIVEPENPKDHHNYVEHGSDRHAAQIGLRKAEEDDPYTVAGWTLEDPTRWGATADEKFIMLQTRQRVSELTSPIPVPQSKDPRLPHFAPIMWTPDIPFSQITE